MARYVYTLLHSCRLQSKVQISCQANMVHAVQENHYVRTVHFRAAA